MSRLEILRKKINHKHGFPLPSNSQSYVLKKSHHAIIAFLERIKYGEDDRLYIDLRFNLLWRGQILHYISVLGYKIKRIPDYHGTGYKFVRRGDRKLIAIEKFHLKHVQVYEITHTRTSIFDLFFNYD